MKEKQIISDEYLIRSGTITIRIYLFGNSQGKNIKPRIQVEIKDADGHVLWDKNYDSIPLLPDDLGEIDLQICAYSFMKERQCSVIVKWDNGAQKYIKLFEVLTAWKIKNIFKDILLDSHQSCRYLASKFYDGLME